MMEMFHPIIGALIAGGLIGLEREWRGRPAGFRTHLLVCLASALLMQAAMLQARWAFVLMPNQTIVLDPTRMAHGILTGLGFLCAGVIFRTGFSVHGLTTAATLWITATIGILFGVGLETLGGVATVVTVVILVLLKVVSLRVPPRGQADIMAAWSSAEPETEAQVERTLAAFHPDLKAGDFEMLEDGALIRRSWRIDIRRDRNLGDLAHELRGIKGLKTYRLDPRED